CVLLAQNGFVPVLKQRPVTPVSTVEVLGIPGQQPPHYRGYGLCTRLEQQVHMIAHQYPGKASGLSIKQNIPESIDECVSVMIVPEYLAALYPPDDDMVQCSCSIYSRFPRHDRKNNLQMRNVNISRTSPWFYLIAKRYC